MQVRLDEPNDVHNNVVDRDRSYHIQDLFNKILCITREVSAVRRLQNLK